MNDFLYDALNLENLDSQPYFIGMMSGTSLDALDAVLCRFDERPVVIASHSISFPSNLKAALAALTMPNGVDDYIKQAAVDFESELDVFGWASVEYGELAAVVVHELLNKAGVGSESVCAIGCHGQTVRHRPQWRFSLQLLDPNVLTERTNIAVVSDFRRRDMAVNGQGAPLAPAFHEAIFNSDYDDTNHRALLNLGGIANITVLSHGEREVIGFDTGCANLLLDGWIKRHTGADFDKNGNWAKSGQIIMPLLEQLLTHPFFEKPYPKSTGREEFNLAWLDQELEKFNKNYNSTHTPADVEATLVELTSVSVARALSKIMAFGDLFVCGGGALNGYLMTRLAHNLPTWHIQSTQTLGIPPTLVESLAFAWLAQQTMLSQPNNLPSVTGAKKSVVLGQVCFP